MERRLSAILVADIVGYSRLMETNEARTLAVVKSRWNTVLTPLVTEHSGRIVKFMGDSVMIEFSSAVNAVTCAVALQRKMAEENAALRPDEQVTLRVGINIGDVLIEGDDIFGDGVNIAARLEALAEAGGICISEAVHHQVRGKIQAGFEDGGRQSLKNIADPVQVYRVVMDTTAASPHVQARAPARTSIAVLPFDNMSGDPEQGYFSDGITEDIIAELSKFKELQVIARNSSFQFRGKAVDIKDVARKLDVQFVVEGSVRRMGNRVRVTVQLIDALSAAHVWAERYDRELTDVFAIQDEITRSITARVADISQTVLAQRIRTRPTTSMTAFDHYLRGRELFINYDTSLESISFLEQARDLDPNFAIAYALLADGYCFRHGLDRRSEHIDQALVSAKRALALDPQEPWAHYAMALVLCRLNRLDDAGSYFERAHALNPNDVYILAVYAGWLSRMERNEEALARIDEALRRDPYAYDWFWDQRAMILVNVGRYEDSIESFKRMKSFDTVPSRSYCFQAICHIELGQIDSARLAVERCRNGSNGKTPEEILAEEPYGNPETAARLMASLKRAVAAAAD